MAKLLDRLGFTENPFAEYVAENEPNIDQYFVRAPYFDSVSERGLTAKSFILFGARGAGKSASRLALHKQGWSSASKGDKQSLLVTLDSFSFILRHGLSKVGTRDFLLEIGYLVAEAILVWLAALSDEDREHILNSLDDEDRRLAITTIDKFYLSRPSAARRVSSSQAAKLLNQAWQERTGIWIQKRWGKIAGLVSAIADAIVEKSTDLEVPIDAHLSDLLASPPKAWNEAHFARALLERLVDFSKSFGFNGITVLVDKVDETDVTGNSAKASASLMYPILANTQLLEVDGLGWMMFIWDKLKSEYSDGDMKIRLDKIANAEIRWEPTYLESMIGERLSYFSDGKVTSLSQLFNSTIDGDAALAEIVSASMNSPRELIRALDTVIREHEDIHSGKSDTPLLDPRSVSVALDKYSAEATQRIYSKLHLQQISRVGASSFINTQVQAALRINNQSARSRINEWIDAGLVAHTGSRPAEGGSGGKPAYEYNVVDARVRRLLERDISLGAEFDFQDLE